MNTATLYQGNTLMLRNILIVLLISTVYLILSNGLCYAQRGLEIEEERNALVIGNSDYVGGITPLRNPVNDANSISLTLERLGFNVIKRINANRSEMRNAVYEFGDRLKKGGVGLFFYAGHGLQVNGENYLVPIDANVRRKYDVPDQCLKASYVLSAMEESGNRLNIIILDACRNNPFRTFRSSQGGLAKMDAPTGSLIAYATAPGSVAQDGLGENGLYTTFLLKHMQKPGLEILDMFRKVRIDVMKESGSEQVPWESTSLTREFYFYLEKALRTASGPDEAVIAPPPKPDAPVIIRKALESGYAVQVSAYNKVAMAEKDKTALIRNGLDAHVEKVIEGQRIYYRLLIGRFAAISEAEIYARELRNHFALQEIGIRHELIVRRFSSAPEAILVRPAIMYRVVRVESWDVLYIRKQPNPKSGKLGAIPANGKNIEFLQETSRYGRNTWYKIRYESTIGWVNSYYLKPM